MLNSSSTANNHINVNAVSGTLVKNYKDSFFYRFHLNSPDAKKVFNYENPHLTVGYGYDAYKKPIVVIQSMVCGDMEVICEIMWREDFDRMFQGENECG